MSYASTIHCPVLRSCVLHCCCCATFGIETAFAPPMHFRCAMSSFGIAYTLAVHCPVLRQPTLSIFQDPVLREDAPRAGVWEDLEGGGGGRSEGQQAYALSTSDIA
eukprot:2538853-Rhodomonas_salina.3